MMATLSPIQRHIIVLSLVWVEREWCTTKTFTADIGPSNRSKELRKEAKNCRAQNVQKRWKELAPHILGAQFDAKLLDILQKSLTR
jgi:hypothetical protein